MSCYCFQKNVSIDRHKEISCCTLQVSVVALSVYMLYQTTTRLQLNMRSNSSWPLKAAFTVYKWNKSDLGYKHTDGLFSATTPHIWLLCAFVNTRMSGLTSTTIKVEHSFQPLNYPTFLKIKLCSSLRPLWFIVSWKGCCWEVKKHVKSNSNI